MDRDSLVIRNQRLAEAFHQVPIQHRLRAMLIGATSFIPVRQLDANVNRVLLIRPDHIGDVLLTTPAIRALKKTRPDIVIHMLVGEWSSSVLANYPEVEWVLTVPFPGFDREQSKSSALQPYRQLLHSAHLIRKVGYSSAVILRPDHWWGAMLAYFAGIRERIGYDLPNVVPFLTEKFPHEHTHAVRQNARLVERWTGHVDDEDLRYEFPIDESDKADIDDYLSDWGINVNTPLICIHPGSGTWVKQWDESLWAKVADRLIDQYGVTVIFTGGKSELPIIERIKTYMRHSAHVIAGSTSIGQLGALYQRSRLVLGVDSGPMHLAAAVHTPTATLFGPADPIEFAPWGNPNKHIVLTSDIACRPCRVLDWHDDKREYHPCLRDISVSRVLSSANQLLHANQE